jgi:hypothetical protein
MIMMNWGAHPRRVTWKRDKRAVLIIHPETAQHTHSPLNAVGHRDDLDGRLFRSL